MLRSAWQMLTAMTRLRSVWIGAVVLIPPLLLDSVLRDRIPRDYRAFVPHGLSSIALALLALLLAAAVLVVFHRARVAAEVERAALAQRVARLESMLAMRDRRRRKLERLAAIAKPARALRAARFVSELDWQSWSDSYRTWLASATEQIEGYFTTDDLALFRNVAGIGSGEVSGAYSEVHNARLLELDRYLANLDKLIDRYEE